MSTIYLFDKQLRLLNVIGFHPRYQNAWSRVKACTFITAVNFMICELVAQIVLNWTGVESIQTIGLMLMLPQMVHRTITMFTHRTDFIELLDCLENMEYPNYLKDLDRMRVELLSKYGIICRKYMNFFLWLLEIETVVTLLLVPVILRMNATYFSMYHYKHSDSPYREIFSTVIFLIGVVVVTFFLVPFEFLFVSFIIYLICQLKVLKEGLLLLGSEKMSDNKDIVGFMVSRHCLILRCVEYVNDIYSGIFFDQFLSSLFCICSSLLGVVVEGSIDWKQNALPFTAIVVSLAQLFLLCMGGTLLMDECESVGNAAYGCEWWRETQPTLRRSAMLIILRSRQSEMLVAGGMIPMNLVSFAGVLKGAYSFYSLLKYIYD